MDDSHGHLKLGLYLLTSRAVWNTLLNKKLQNGVLGIITFWFNEKSKLKHLPLRYKEYTHSHLLFMCWKDISQNLTLNQLFL